MFIKHPVVVAQMAGTQVPMVMGTVIPQWQMHMYTNQQAVVMMTQPPPPPAPPWPGRVPARLEIKGDRWFPGTSLCGCVRYTSPVDGRSHCLRRSLFALCCGPCAVGALMSTAVREKPETCDMGSPGYTAWVGVSCSTLMGGLGYLAPAMVAPMVRARYIPLMIRPSTNCQFCAKACYCHVCFLVQLRNWTELMDYSQQLTTIPNQQYMV